MPVIIFLISFFLGCSHCCVAQIEVKNTLPETFVKNIPYDIKITITKNDFVSHFAKYQLETPAGFTVKETECKDGLFSFENRIAKVVWIMIPRDSSFTITFNIIATQQAKASGRFIERFIFLEDKERDETKLKIKQIKVIDYHDSLLTTLLKPNKPIFLDTTKRTTTTLIQSNSLSPKTEFRLQLGAFKQKPSLLPFVSLQGVRVENREGLYKIYCGSFSTKDEAIKHQKTLQKKGFESYVMEIRGK